MTAEGYSGLALEDGSVYRCRALVVTTGTFLNGLVHVGPEQRPAGRADEPPSRDLAESIKALGVRWGRLKTGTPPRLARRSIDFDEGVKRGVFHVEHGDPDPIAFSFTATDTPTNQIVCHLLHTTERVHELVRSSIQQSPLFNGQIEGIGPRYCPSLEDKVMRFPQRERHQLFLEPEGLDVEEIYVNGFSMSLPVETQKQLVNALPGLGKRRDAAAWLRRRVRLRPADGASLVARDPSAAQGCFSPGKSTALRVTKRRRGRVCSPASTPLIPLWVAPPFVLGRDEAYLGIMVDDLITKGLPRAVSHVHVPR